MKLADYIKGLHPAELAQAEAEGYVVNKQPPPRVRRVVPPEILAARKEPSRIWWDKFERSVRHDNER